MEQPYRDLLFIFESRSFFIIYHRRRVSFLYISSSQKYVKKKRTLWRMTDELGWNVAAFVCNESNIIRIHRTDPMIIDLAKSCVREKCFGADIRYFKECLIAICQYLTLMHDVHNRRAKVEPGWPTCKSLLPRSRDYFFFRYLIPLEDHKIISRSYVMWRLSIVKNQARKGISQETSLHFLSFWKYLCNP